MPRSASSKLAVHLRTLEPPTLELVRVVTDRVAELLQELEAREEPKKHIAVWLVRRVDVGSLSIEVEGRPARDQINPEIIDVLCRRLLDDIQSITEDPVAWSERQRATDSDYLQALRQLGALSVEHKVTIAVRHDGRQVDVAGALVEKVDVLLQARFQDWGSVEGYLEMVTLHRQRYFRIYPRGGAQGVECHFEEDLLARVRELLGRRVSMWGRLRRSRTGYIQRADVKHIEPLEPLTLDEIRPEAPLWPGKSYEELHRGIWEE